MSMEVVERTDSRGSSNSEIVPMTSEFGLDE
jgi:hypothetical protein